MNANYTIQSLFVTVFLTFISAFLQSCQPSLPSEVEQAYKSLPEKVDFNFHIRPILADRCYKCHGPDDNKREAELRLDIEESAFARLKESDGYAIVKGNIGKSIAWQRITSDDPDFQMPPPDSHLGLSAREKALITKWIEQGAEWKEHWAFIPPSKPETPQLDNRKIQNPIDNFILARLKQEKLTPSPEADKERLIRRLSFDLTGLPPTLDEVDVFLSDTSSQAYEKQVDRLLQTDAYAERMALEWLDVARFGDTQGMHMDPERFNWPWRDWVISAFKHNMAYDEFITWQMAGDLLPDPSRMQKLATAFHRNHPSSSEGGISDNEFRQKYVQDRTNTTATAFMGLTLECASCHDHKFDPISQKEYYQMTAFFNNLKEVGMVNEFRVSADRKGPVYASGPALLLPESQTERQLLIISNEIDKVRKQRSLTRSQLLETRSFIQSITNQPLAQPKPDAAFPFESIQAYKTKFGVVHRSQNNQPIDKMVDYNPSSLACGNPQVVNGKIGKALRSPRETDIVFLKDVGTFELYEPFSAGAWVLTEKTGENQTIMGTSGELGSAWRGWDLFLDSLNRPCVSLVSIRPQNYLQVRAEVSVSQNEWHHIFFTYEGTSEADGVHIYIDGKRVKVRIDYDHLYKSIVRRWGKNEEFQTRPMMVFRSGRFHLGENGVFTGILDELNIFRKYLTPLEVATLYEKENPGSIAWGSFESEDYLDHYLYHMHPAYQKLSGQLRGLLAKRLDLINDVPEIMVMEDMPLHRPTYVLDRGQYDAPTIAVDPGTPAILPSFQANFPPNRFGLAQWLVDKNHPLTARVVVNRYWQMIFGRGLVKTPHDFGTQGALPTHPELLDWLAINFMESGWDVRALLKTMVMSATYRQSSVASEAHMALDPQNLLLARGPSYRLQAEMIRDNALAASGLLVRKVGGPSVKPYQPEGIWDFGGLVSGNYEPDSGANLYRRSMYTYIRRTSPHPAMVAFDAPNRLVCIARRENTNTPLQALVLLNDPQFVEASRLLAERMQKEGGEKLEDQLTYGFRLVCGRRPGAAEMALMKEQLQFARDRFGQHPERVEELLNTGEYPFDQELDPIETAALAMVANTMMNFDEAYMKR